MFIWSCYVDTVIQASVGLLVHCRCFLENDAPLCPFPSAAERAYIELDWIVVRKIKHEDRFFQGFAVKEQDTEVTSITGEGEGEGEVEDGIKPFGGYELDDGYDIWWLPYGFVGRGYLAAPQIFTGCHHDSKQPPSNHQTQCEREILPTACPNCQFEYLPIVLATGEERDVDRWRNWTAYFRLVTR